MIESMNARFGKYSIIAHVIGMTDSTAASIYRMTYMLNPDARRRLLNIVPDTSDRNDVSFDRVDRDIVFVRNDIDPDLCRFILTDILEIQCFSILEWDTTGNPTVEAELEDSLLREL